LSLIEDVFSFAERSDPRRNRFLDHLSKTAEQADDAVSLYRSIGRLTLLTQQYAFGCLPGARVVSRPYAALHKRYYSIFRPSPQQSERSEAGTVYTRGFLNKLSEQRLMNFTRAHVSN
jgi:hypothetical protein